MTPPSRGIRIAELARRSGTSKETIHFYLREGLLRKPKKTSRNMAYYDETHVEQLKLIKRLRTESYLPLHVIKKVLKEGRLGSSARHLDLAGELFGQGAKTEFEPLSRKALSEKTGIDEKRLAEMEEAGLLRPKMIGGKKRYGYEDVRVAEIVLHAEKEMGEGGEKLVLERFSILERHMGELVRDEVAHFFSRVVAEGDPKRALELLRGGRDTIGKYMALARARRMKDEVEAMMPAIESAIGSPTPEPLYYELPDGVLAKTNEGERRKALMERFEKKPEDPTIAAALFEHLVLVGDSADVIVLNQSLRGRARENPAVLALVAESMLERERMEDAFAILDKLREERETPDPMLEALWGSAVLIRLRRNFPTLRSSTELIGYITRAFSAFDVARSAPAASRLQSARVHLLLGRICVSTPEFLGARDQGREDLKTCLEEVRKLRELGGELQPPAEPARGKPEPALEAILRDLSYGALERIEHNARHFLMRAPRSDASEELTQDLEAPEDD